ncbi:heavy metal translocating P-type ATPase [uncultured Anaerococcus sp.]|uniref:heavy metal translocating P-type ATPase n=1 Tax=uncultured Anaerococcus sp. TaxID=293428 RepID=UPI00288B56A9|nr:heavy metal translocating P-type ATPase [uncultured Anaerococcus sp.]
MLKSMTTEHKETFLKLVLIIFLSFALSYFDSHIAWVNIHIVRLWFLALYLFAAWDVLKEAFEGLKRGQALDENFLMTIATVTAFIIGEYLEAIAVMVFYGFGELFEEIATHSSKENIKHLLDLVPDLANKVLDDGTVEEIDLDDVEVGDILMVRDGEKVGVDGVIIEGVALVDTSSVTGESMPVEVKPGDEIISSSIISQGIIKYEATKEFDDSVAAKIIELIEDSHMSKSDSERLISRFAKVYTPIVVAFAAILALVPPLLMGGAWSDYLIRAATFLVLSCPCALVLSVPLSFMSGLGLASREGILIKGSQYLEELVAADILLTDKTGTLTTGEFVVKDIEFLADYDKEKALDYIYNIEKMSTHPIARGIVTSLSRPENPDLFKTVDNKSGLGVVAESQNGEEIKIGSAKFIGIENEEKRAVYLSIDSKPIARVIIEDEVKKDSKKTIDSLKKDFKEIAVVSGDSVGPVKDLAEELDLTDYYAGLMPKDKLDIMEKFKNQGHKLVFVGDGINDAPVLKNANVGISMGETASDLAIESSDILVANGEFKELARLMKIAKLTNSTVMQNITFIMTVKVLILILGLLGHASMWLAIFGDVGVSIIAILWAMRILKKRL